ncbi:MAG: UDP-N-acetylglucosamine 2-epimerase (non-hydrolyzing) [Alphaproteobacteria bacterium]|nr:MAG: UDP-N-acetylglucosamine 2-epimerase (non-hydrolyzing) [Alphaproteobacteria bacterium]
MGKYHIYNGDKALFCCGSRPELIKISPVYHQLRIAGKITPLLCNTGQQKDLLTPHLDIFDIKADFQLDVMVREQSLDQLMTRLFTQLPRTFDQCQPDIVIIQGDTASALAAATIAHTKNLPIAHIEAGLRTHDKASPFPEEIYRKNISTLAQWHFCPTEKARQNLLRENIAQENIFVTGNTSVDMVIKTHKELNGNICHMLPFRRNRARPFFLITLHRRESQGAPLMQITTSLLTFIRSRPEFDFILPLHPNPATSHMIKSRLGGQKNIFLIAPLPYPQFVRLMADAFAIITDSGGIQEEAPSLNTPVIVVRNKTERAEGVESGCLRLAGTGNDTILYELNLLIDDKAHYKRMQQAPNPFGDGQAADRICAHLTDIVEKNHAPTYSPKR